MIGRELAVMESASQCSSGCQSGWTVYLEHSGHQQQHCAPPYRPVQREALQPAEYSGEEDSMVSDASSGPPPRLCEEEDGVRDLQQRQGFGYRCYSSSSGHRSEGSSGSGCFGSTRPRSPGAGEKTSKKRRAVVAQGEKAVRRGGNDDDLDDTASSSAVFSCHMFFPIDVVEDLHECAFSAKQLLHQWPAVQSASMQRCKATP